MFCGFTILSSEVVELWVLVCELRCRILSHDFRIQNRVDGFVSSRRRGSLQTDEMRLNFAVTK